MIITAGERHTSTYGHIEPLTAHGVLFPQHFSRPGLLHLHDTVGLIETQH